MRSKRSYRSCVDVRTAVQHRVEQISEDVLWNPIRSRFPPIARKIARQLASIRGLSTPLDVTRYHGPDDDEDGDACTVGIRWWTYTFETKSVAGTKPGSSSLRFQHTDVRLAARSCCGNREAGTAQPWAEMWLTYHVDVNVVSRKTKVDGITMRNLHELDREKRVKSRNVTGPVLDVEVLYLSSDRTTAVE
jgi:hypothetical protein